MSLNFNLIATCAINNWHRADNAHCFTARLFEHVDLALGVNHALYNKCHLQFNSHVVRISCATAPCSCSYKGKNLMMESLAPI